MADKSAKLPINAPGRFYVDNTCIDCDLCRNTAPEFFQRDDESGFSYVARQPVTPEEIALAEEALEGCPCESIGNDGDVEGAEMQVSEAGKVEGNSV
jgi:ferredoxin